jgi:peptide/nickel transport system substrate-binding protein
MTDKPSGNSSRPHCQFAFMRGHGHTARLALFSAVLASTLSSALLPAFAGPNDVIQKADSPSAGPFKTVVVNGTEFRQTRFPAGQFGGTLVKSIVSTNPATFNYWQSNDVSSRELAALMFVGLLDSDPNTGDVVPLLAEKVSVGADKVTYTAKLRKGLKWSDGKPITSADVVYTWNTIIAGGYGNSSLRDITQVDGKSPVVTAIDPLTVKFVTAKPFVPFIKTLGLPIAPKHVFEPITNQKDGRTKFGQVWSTEAKPSDFVTSGPFTLKAYVPSQRIEFVRTKNFCVADAKGTTMPYLQYLNYIIVPNPVTNLLKFKGKEIDLTAVRPAECGELAKMAKAGNFKLYDFGPSQGSIFVCFNLNQRKNPKTGKSYVDPVKSAWFNDINFRQALSYAMDRQTVVNNYFKGLGEPSFSPFPVTSPFFNKALKPYSKDLVKAKALLSKSGFTWDKAGNLTDKGGHKVEFDMLANSGSNFADFFCSSFKEDLKGLGIKLNTQQIDFNVLGNRINQSGEWEFVMFALSGGDPLEPNDSANVFKSDGRLHLFDQRFPDAAGKVNVTDARPWEKRVDELFNKGAVTFDTAERKKIYNEAQQIYYDQMPMIYVATPKHIVGVRNTIHNYFPTPLSQQSNGLHNLEELWVK